MFGTKVLVVHTMDLVHTSVMFTLLTSLTSSGHVQTNSPDVELCALTGVGNAKRLLSYCSWAVLPLTGSNDIKQYNRVNETLLSYYCTALMLTSSGDPQKMQTSPSCCFPAQRWWGPSNTTLMIGGGRDITLVLLSCTQVVLRVFQALQTLLLQCSHAQR